MLSLIAAALLSQGWSFLEEPSPQARVRQSPPSSFARREALDELQGALGQWQKERREFAQERRRLEQIRERAASAAEVPQEELPAEVMGKVIELAPTEPSAASAEESPPADASALEQEMLRMEAELADRSRWCDENPEACARKKKEREVVREGNRAWEEALEKKRQRREAEIEAEARRIQAELDAARAREAKARAKELGGRLDDRGQFVDEDLDAELEADSEREE